MNSPSQIFPSFLKKLFAIALLFCAQTTFAQKADSIIHHYDSLYDGAAKVKLSIPDSLQAVAKLNSMKQGLQHKIDSLQNLNLPTEKYTQKLDSLNKINPQKYVEMVNGRVKNLENKINDKLNVMRQEGGDKANLPGNLDTKDISLNKNLDINTPSINKPSFDNPLGNTAIEKPSIDNPLNKVDNPLGDIKNASQQQLDKVKSVDELQTIKEKAGQLNQASDKLQSYEGEVKKIADGNLNEMKEIPDAIEKKAGSLDEIKDLQKQTGEIGKAQGELDKVKGMAGKVNDAEALKTMAGQEITKQAVDHFKGKEQVLQQAMDKVSKLKQKYPDLQSLKDIPKRPPNPMKGKPLIERIVPGVTLQVMKSNNVMIDFNPVVSYRFSGRINAGLGWNERFSFDKWNKLNTSDRTYGPRVFGSFSFKKGFSAKAEIEKMNTLIPPSALSADGSRQWVWSAFVGIKKDYNFIGRVKGNVQVLYNLYDDHDNSPYADRLNVRMGFEFPMKKARKPVKTADKKQ